MMIKEGIIVSLIVVAGLLLNLFREIFFLYKFGDSQVIDQFRLVSAVPLAIVGLVGQSMVAIFSVEMAKNNSSISTVLKILNVVLLFSLLLSFALLFVRKSYFGQYYGKEIVLLYILFIAYSIFCLISAFSRAYLISKGSKMIAVSYSVVLVGMSIILIGVFDFYNDISLPEIVVAYVLSSFVLLIFYWKRSRLSFKALLVLPNPPSILLYSILVLCAYRLTNVIPKFIDRSVFARNANAGDLALLEYSFAFVSFPVTVASIIYVTLTARMFGDYANKFINILKVTGVFYLLVLFVYFCALLILNNFSPDGFQFGKVDGDLLNELKAYILVHIHAIPALGLNSFLIIMLIHQKEYMPIFIGVMLKLASKLLLLQVLPWPIVENALYSFYYSEYILSVVLFISVFITYRNYSHDTK